MINPNEIYNKLVSLGHDWADKDSAADLLEQTRKSIRANIMTECFIDGFSASKAEAYAECDQRYIDHINAMCEARKQSNLALVNYHAGKVWAESIRTAESTRRAEMNIR